jgi:hypothetical protein
MRVAYRMHVLLRVAWSRRRTSCSASATLPLWFTPASAMMKHGSVVPIVRSPMCMCAPS